MRVIRTDDIFECRVVNVQFIDGTQTCLLSLKDKHVTPEAAAALAATGASGGGSDSVEMYLHQRYSFAITQKLIVPGQTVRIIGAKLVDQFAKLSVPLRLLPTPYMTFLLDRRLHGDIFRANLTDVNFDAPLDQDTGFLFRIIDVGQVEKAKTPGRIKQLRILLREWDNPEGPEVLFALWDEQTAFAELFRRGDTLGIYRPYIGPPGPHNGWQQMPFFEYGTATVVFYEPFEMQKVGVFFSYSLFSSLFFPLHACNGGLIS